jgi:hypothetical protein
MQASQDHVYQAAHQEVERLQATLEEQAELFNSAFALSANEIEHLHAHAELHVTGASIEFFVPEMDIVFSMGTLFDRPNDSDAWELVAYHGQSSVAQWVCTMRVGPTDRENTRRVRGARLVTVIGDYLDRQQIDTPQTDAYSTGLHVIRMKSNITWLPQVAAHSALHEA